MDDAVQEMKAVDPSPPINLTVEVERWPMSHSQADVTLAQVAPLIVDFLIETGETVNGTVRPPNFGILMQLWEKGLLQIVLARVDGKIVGWRMATFQADPILNANVISMRGAYVAPAFRRKGVGQRMQNVMMHRAIMQRGHQVYATADEGTPMQRMLIKDGFVRLSSVYRKRIN